MTETEGEKESHGKKDKEQKKRKGSIYNRCAYTYICLFIYMRNTHLLGFMRG